VNDKPHRIDTVVISTQHDPVIEGETDNERIQKRIADDMHKHVIAEVFKHFTVKPDADTKYFINPSGRFVIGGPQGDAGLTGRKIIVDTYGGYARHGGGAFSGKDPTKVDRSAAYAARWVAKNIVSAGLADKCEIQLGYAIGVARPMSINVNTWGTGQLSDSELATLVEKTFDLRPAAIIQNFDLQGQPGKNKGRFYRNVAAYGHLGRPDLDLPWERLDKVEALRAAVGERLGKQPATV
jgi:S-adenosylmethionine synthetase